jgi:hypothetical protein
MIIIVAFGFGLHETRPDEIETRNLPLFVDRLPGLYALTSENAHFGH